MPHQVEVRVPDVGEAEEVEVIEVLVAPGDRVELEDTIVTLESDKATLELPAPQAGVVQSVAVSLGDSVEEGTLLLVLEVEPPAAVAREPAAQAGSETVHLPSADLRPTVSEPSFTPQAPPVPPARSPSGALAHAGPGVRRMARELGFELTGAEGTGPHGRILEEDVRAAVRTALSGTARRDASAPPAVDFSRYGETEVVALNRIRKLGARNLARAWETVPHVTQHDEADVTELEDFRRDHAERLVEEGVRLSPLIFAIKAVAIALRDFPRMRSSLLAGGQEVVVKHYFHIGVAVDTEFGLVVPVVRDVLQKGLRAIATEIAELAERARAKKLRPEHLEGSVFSISSLGGIGGTAFTPLVNAPEVGILGLSRTETKPVWDETEQRFVPRRTLPLSLSYDHRVIDGAEAVRFTTALVRLLGAPAHLLL
ncbi:MAG: 2-oxo acid dehydrogenase subunit E2 [Myxococcota bacterium]|nr:2-oxo acid dehydrogenase subunit E2 [Myxococcota bacterium]